MKNFKTYRRNLLVLLSGSVLFSCQSYLDQVPTDLVSEAIYYQTPAQFEAAANYLYLQWGFEEGDEGSDLSNNFTTSTDGTFGQGISTIPENDAIWSDSYINIRRANIVIQKAYEYGEKEGNDIADIYQSLGTAYFSRAWSTSELLYRFGGVPVVSELVELDSEVLWGPRNSRYEVIAQIISDLDQIINNNMLSSEGSTPEEGMVTLEAAKAFKARICLYAATWDKYVGTSTDGDGVTSGAGSFKPEGYPSQSSFLSMAKQLSKEVIDCGNYKLWDVALTGNEELDQHHERFMMYLFNLEDSASNPWGLQKSDNKEYIFQSIYDYTYRQIRENLSHSAKLGGNRKLMDMCLCTDGLPPHLSSVFQGYETVDSEFENRDIRMTSYAKVPNDFYWDNSDWGTDYSILQSDAKAACDAAIASGQFEVKDAKGNFIDDAFYYHCNDNTSRFKMYYYNYEKSVPMYGVRNIGYYGLKFTSEMNARADNTESFNYPHIRLAEMYLIYAEATYEMDGSISDADLDYSINKLRARARVANLTNALVSAHPDLNMLGEIRRERAIELFGEALRFDDLRRWGVAVETLANKPICMGYVQYEGKDTEIMQYVEGKGSDLSWFPGGGPLTEEVTYKDEYLGGNGLTSTKPGAIVQEVASTMNFAQKNYLSPIPTSQIDLYKAGGYELLQNPLY